MRKPVLIIAALLAITQVVLIILQIAQVVNLNPVWLFSPLMTAVFLGIIFMVVYVLIAEKRGE